MDISTLLYSLAKMQIQLPHALRSLVLDELRVCMFELEPNHLANVGWALATMQTIKPWPALGKPDAGQPWVAQVWLTRALLCAWGTMYRSLAR